MQRFVTFIHATPEQEPLLMQCHTAEHQSYELSSAPGGADALSRAGSQTCHQLKIWLLKAAFSTVNFLLLPPSLRKPVCKVAALPMSLPLLACSGVTPGCSQRFPWTHAPQSRHQTASWVAGLWVIIQIIQILKIKRWQGLKIKASVSRALETWDCCTASKEKQFKEVQELEGRGRAASHRESRSLALL